jgi:hypothetical protein
LKKVQILNIQNFKILKKTFDKTKNWSEKTSLTKKKLKEKAKQKKN